MFCQASVIIQASDSTHDLSINYKAPSTSNTHLFYPVFSILPSNRSSNGSSKLMASAFTHQEEREDTQQQRQQQQCYQLKFCVPVLKLRSSDYSSPFSLFGFWVSKSLKKFYCRGGFPSGFGFKRLEGNVMVVNNSVFCSAPEFLEEGKATMEDLNMIEKNEVNEEIKHEVFTENVKRIETFGELIEEKGRESSSSSDFLTSETTAHEEQSHSSSEESSSPPSLGWPVQKTEVPDCSSVNGNENEEKPHCDDRKLKKQGSTLPGIFPFFVLLSLFSHSGS